jgi:hypothetical protein
VPTLRVCRKTPGHRHAGAGARAAGLATDHPAGDDPPVPVHRVWACVRQDTSRAAEPRARLSRRGLAWALEAIVCQHLSIARVAQGLGVAWNTANDAVLAEGRRVLINDPGRLNGVKGHRGHARARRYGSSEAAGHDPGPLQGRV